MCQAMVDGICVSYFNVTVAKLSVRTNYRRKEFSLLMVTESSVMVEKLCWNRADCNMVGQVVEAQTRNG